MSFTTLSPEKQLGHFENLKKRLSSNGIEEFPLKRRMLENKAIGLSLATKNRQMETERCVGFRKYFEGGYFLEILPTFDSKKGVFSERGVASVLIKTPSIRKGYHKRAQLYFYRQDGMVEKISAISYFFNKLLQERPYGKDGKLMDLVQEKTKKSFSIFFISQDKKEKISILNRRLLNVMGASPYRSVVEEVIGNREYYYENKPEDANSIEKIKKTRTVKSPKNAVPTMS